MIVDSDATIFSFIINNICLIIHLSFRKLINLYLSLTNKYDSIITNSANQESTTPLQ